MIWYDMIWYDIILYYTPNDLGFGAPTAALDASGYLMVAMFCPFGLFCEIVSSLLSLQNHQEQPSIYFRRRSNMASRYLCPRRAAPKHAVCLPMSFSGDIRWAALLGLIPSEGNRHIVWNSLSPKGGSEKGDPNKKSPLGGPKVTIKGLFGGTPLCGTAYSMFWNHPKGKGPSRTEWTTSRPPAPELESIRRAHSITCFSLFRYGVIVVQLFWVRCVGVVWKLFTEDMCTGFTIISTT